jgi:hypothetical protein
MTSGQSISGNAAQSILRKMLKLDRKPCGSILGYRGPAQPSPTLGDALNAGYLYLEVRCLGCDTHQTVALDIVRRPKTKPIHELERYMRCKDCSQVRGYRSSAAIWSRCGQRRYRRAIRRRLGGRVSGEMGAGPDTSRLQMP